MKLHLLILTAITISIGSLPVRGDMELLLEMQRGSLAAPEIIQDAAIYDCDGDGSPDYVTQTGPISQVGPDTLRVFSLTGVQLAEFILLPDDICPACTFWVLWIVAPTTCQEVLRTIENRTPRLHMQSTGAVLT